MPLRQECSRGSNGVERRKTDSTHHILEAISETATVLESGQKLLYTAPSGWWWWWCIDSVFRRKEEGGS